MIAMNRVMPVVMLLGMSVGLFAQAGNRALEATGPVGQLPSADKRWAVLIGVDQYSDRTINGLLGAANDARAMKKTLVEAAGFREEQVVVLASGELEDRQPTRENVLTRLSAVLKLTPKDGLLVVGFSGHGIERQGEAYLLPQNAKLNDDVELLQETSLSVRRLKTMIQGAGIAQVIILLDACRNEPGGRADLKNPLTAGYVNGFRFDVRNQGVKAFATLYATSVGERAWEDVGNKRGYFSLALEEALRGKAANAKGEVTLGMAVRYLQERVPKQVNLWIGPEKKQLPWSEVTGFKAEELVLAVGTGKREEVAVLPKVDEEEVYFAECKERKGAFCEVYLKRYPKGKYVDLAVLYLGEGKKSEVLAPPVVGVSRVEAGELAAGTKRKGPDGLMYVWIPKGEFMMGCSPGDGECFDNEKPARRVEISKGFWMGETEVTQEAYERITGRNPSHFKGSNRPVVNVNWNEATEFCGRVSGRLPSEEEWEYGARAGSTQARYGLLDRVAWYDRNSGKTTHPVAQKEANAWGLHDMLGNVWEWTQTSYDSFSKVLRGGSWDFNSRITRVSSRGNLIRSGEYYVTGFRCVRDSL